MQLFDVSTYMPHGYCLFWDPWLVVLYAGSDLLIFLAYAAIPFALMQVLRRRPDIRYRKLVALFAAFILLCGLTHLVSIVTLWVGVYALHGYLKLATALVSCATAVVLFRLVPRVVAIPSPAQLEAANLRLQQEIAAHESTLAQLREAQRDLEAKVEQRTAALRQANDRLEVLTREMVHRSKNLLAIVSSLARQTARGVPDVKTFVELFFGRISALSNATSAVLGSASQAAAPLEDVLRRQLDPILQTYGGRVTLGGPPVEISAEAAQQFALAVHELATNAVKHGALSSAEGQVRLGWSVSGEELALHWQESGGAPIPEPAPETGGFGMQLLTRAVPAMLNGTAERSQGPEGLSYRLRAPLSSIAAAAETPQRLLEGAAFQNAIAT
ncbi:hypothetical protein C5F48_17455 [Cereibacter changlensis JA139]|uniref:histidine kinase n=2 Tax=Cereibacter changlensis TaxID=402884 RepID=A0A2T4JRC6_9RHOB|nr:sensor histidine kinase [Cereibacter changlensis]PTE20449.1 hypothetical protein C5F48_17455 [Cereibacter changlensis JA139]PZX55166.1 two-component sensor histidine kinase [Cereibacter changlensis]